MKTGYDQFFKNAQKAAEKNQKVGNNGTAVKRRNQVQTQDAKLLAQELRKIMKPRIQKKAVRRFPWKFVMVSFFGFLFAGSGMIYLEEIEAWTKRIEISLGVAQAEEVKPAADEKAAGKEKEKGAKEDAKAAPAAKREYTEEDFSHFSKLNERKRELDAREEELSRMEQELQAQKVELQKRLEELENTRKGISSVLEERVQADDKKVDNLVQMYSSMKPQQAAKAFEEMDEGLAIEILGRMKKKNAAEIMNLVKSEKVKILSEKYAGYKRNN